MNDQVRAKYPSPWKQQHQQQYQQPPQPQQQQNSLPWEQQQNQGRQPSPPPLPPPFNRQNYNHRQQQQQNQPLPPSPWNPQNQQQNRNQFLHPSPRNPQNYQQPQQQQQPHPLPPPPWDTQPQQPQQPPPQPQRSLFKPQTRLDLSQPPQRPLQPPKSETAQILIFLCSKGIECIFNGMTNFDQIIRKVGCDIREFAARGFIKNEPLACSLASSVDFGVLLILTAGVDAKDMDQFIFDRYRCHPEDVISRLASTHEYDDILNRNKLLNAFKMSILPKKTDDSNLRVLPQQQQQQQQQQVSQSVSDSGFFFPPTNPEPGGHMSVILQSSGNTNTPPVVRKRFMIQYKDPRSVNLVNGAVATFRRFSLHGLAWYEYCDGNDRNRYPIHLHQRIANKCSENVCGVRGCITTIERVTLSEAAFGMGEGSEVIILDLDFDRVEYKY